jgi:hypothetical protein
MMAVMKSVACESRLQALLEGVVHEMHKLFQSAVGKLPVLERVGD